MMIAAAAAASIEARHAPPSRLNFATAGLVPAAIVRSVAARVVETLVRSHLGFDTNKYPGDKAMAAWKRSSNYEWVGYYLEAPCHRDHSWTGTRKRLENNGWGVAVIYVGQQTWGRRSWAPSSTTAKSSARKRRTSTKSVTTKGATCSSAFVSEARGVADAQDAIAKASAEGFPKGTIVFLDVEHMAVIPSRMRAYYRAWTRTMLAAGTFRPGIYSHTKNAAAIYDDVSALYAQAKVKASPPFWVSATAGFSPGRMPTEVGHAFATAWQGMLNVVRTHNGVRLPIDISVANHPSPSRATQ
jgi:hypothetical protein